MRKGLFMCLLALGIVAMVPGTSSAQASATGQMDFDINLPDIVVLYYFSEVDVNLSATQLISSPDVSTGGAAVSVGTTSGSGLGPDLAISAPALTTTGGINLAQVDVTLQNAWAVRALSSDDEVDVTFIADQADLTNASTSDTIAINSVTVSSGAETDTSSDPTGTAAAIAVPSPGLINSTEGNLGMQLDLTGATSSGTYNGDFTIVASVP